MKNRAGLIVEFWEFLKQNKKWWVIPMVLIMLTLAGLMLFSGSPVAPFIYTVF